MAVTSLGVYRRLQTLSTADGHFNILAVDHRDALRAAVDPDDPSSVPDSTLVDLKLRLVASLGGHASAIMLEPEFSMAQTIASGILPPDCGFTAAIEAQGYLADPSAATNATLPGWSVEAAAASGASAAKILVLWDPSDDASQRAQVDWIEGLVHDCARVSMPLLLEPIIRKQVPFDAHLTMIERMSSLKPDILKLAIPPGETRFHLLDQAASGRPWVLLSAGVGFELFAEQVGGACEAGASGFAVGRALWGEYLHAPADRVEETVAAMVGRLRSLRDTTSALATSWTERVAAPRSDAQWFLDRI
jgi:tagatose 1,6-diphosphate aldolase